MEYESIIRLTSFFGIFILMASWEVMAPRRLLSTSKPKRWFANFGIVFLNTLVIRVLFSTAAVGAAFVAGQKGWGVLNVLEWPTWVVVVVAVVTLDFVIYLQHVMFHAVPLLWRLHMVHHADLDVDVTTGARFHPIEVTLSMVIKLAVVVLIGASPWSVLIFEVLLNATSMFNHSNVRIPERFDWFLRWLVVTPDMHRIHHSVIREETNSNFGFNLPWWDRLLGTYRPDPAKGQTGMTIGLDQFRNPDHLTLLWILALPFVGGTGNYPLNRGER